MNKFVKIAIEEIEQKMNEICRKCEPKIAVIRTVKWE